MRAEEQIRAALKWWEAEQKRCVLEYDIDVGVEARYTIKTLQWILKENVNGGY